MDDGRDEGVGSKLDRRGNVGEHERLARIRGGVHEPVAHDSAVAHVTGEALYVDDVAEPAGTLHAAIGTANRAYARIRLLDLAAVESSPGVAAVVMARDVPGVNDFGPVHRGDPVFAGDTVEFAGQVLFAVAAVTRRKARRAARRALVEYADLEPLLTVEDALSRGSFVTPSREVVRGDPHAAIDAAPLRVAGRLGVGGQDHFYLEGQVSLAVPTEQGELLVYSSTQHPSEVQALVARALAIPLSAVTVEVRRLGGGFGGKETQAAQFAVIAALLAARTGKPVKLRLDRDDDMVSTGKRHDFKIDYEVGFDADGRIRGLDLGLAARCGMSADLSGAVCDRAVLHCDNAYYLDAVRIVSHRCRTHTVSNTAFRGFGAPQAMMGIELVIDEIARALCKDPLDVRLANLYGSGERDTTPYGMTVDGEVVADIMRSLEHRSAYRERRREIEAFNAKSRALKRGIALTPVKFGISFVTTHLNQGGALVNVYLDGSIQVNHGGTEMGQGLYVKVAQIVAEELQVDLDRVKVTAANTGKVPNTSATAASSSTDLNGEAARKAAYAIKQRLVDVAASHFGVARDAVRFEPNRVRAGARTIAFAELVALAHRERVSLSATGFHATPKIHFQPDSLAGRPFLYFACGAAVSEVVVDTLTGEHRVLRVDILHDCGRSVNPAVDRGQIEGGFVQGMGWLTTEELSWDDEGRIATHSPSTYKIPTASDVPQDFRVDLYEHGANREEVVHRSKAVGEPPLMLAISVFQAIRDAIAGATGGASPRLDAPATPERVLRAIDELRDRAKPSTERRVREVAG